MGENEELREALLGPDGDDDLEFYITFPTPTALGTSSDEEGFDFALDPEGATEPLVFVLGWAGCTDRQLSKYSKIYEERGCITIRYSAPGEYILFDPEKIRPLASKLLDLVSEMSLESSPIFFHCFSNSGATVYQCMVEAMANEKQYEGMAERVMGQVFDSAPGKRTANSFINAFSYVWPGKNFLFRYFVPRIMLLYAIALSIYHSMAAHFTGKILQPFCYDYILNEKIVRPLLFIYSKTDKVLPASDIDAVADAREKNGCEVVRVCYDDSEHVDHLRQHRETYINNIDGFVRKCLEGNGKKSLTNQNS